MTFFWCRFDFGKCFGASFWSSHWAGPHQFLYTAHFLLHIMMWWRSGSLLLHRIRRRCFKTTIFFISVSSWGTHSLSFFTFPICLKCWATIEWATLSSLTRVVERGSFLMILSVGGCQLPVPATALLIFKVLVFFAKLPEPPLHCMFISSSWAKCIIDVALLLYHPLWTRIRKLLEFAFCLTSFP